MTYYKKETFDSSDRLNNILDKINEKGKKSLTKMELEFLDSFSLGKENEVNEIIASKESEEFFLSDDGSFSFKLEETEIIDDVYYYKGIMMTPDRINGRKVISGTFKGAIIVYTNKSIAIDFYNERYDIFDVNIGSEYELDCFIDDILEKLHKGK